jgi:hypothetical protein
VYYAYTTPSLAQPAKAREKKKTGLKGFVLNLLTLCD